MYVDIIRRNLEAQIQAKTIENCVTTTTDYEVGETFEN